MQHGFFKSSAMNTVVNYFFIMLGFSNILFFTLFLLSSIYYWIVGSSSPVDAYSFANTLLYWIPLAYISYISAHLLLRHKSQFLNAEFPEYFDQYLLLISIFIVPYASLYFFIAWRPNQVFFPIQDSLLLSLYVTGLLIFIRRGMRALGSKRASSKQKQKITVQKKIESSPLQVAIKLTIILSILLIGHSSYTIIMKEQHTIQALREAIAKKKDRGYPNMNSNIGNEYLVLIKNFGNEETNIFLKAIRIGEEPFIRNELKKSYVENPEFQIVALATAIASNQKKLFQLFLQHKFTFTKRHSIYENLPMLFAIGSTDISYLQSLLDLGASPNVQTKDKPIIHYSQNETITRLLLKYNAQYSLNDLYSSAKREDNFPQKQRSVPSVKELFESLLKPTSDLLTFVINKGDIQAVKLLLKRGLDVNAMDSQGHTALKVAIDANQTEVFQILLKRGANKNLPFPESLQQKKGIYPIHLSAIKGRQDICNTLLETGENINRKDQLGNSPLYHAVKSDKQDMVAFLLEKGADIYSKNLNGETLLSLPIKNIMILKLLRKHVKEEDKSKLAIDPNSVQIIHEQLTYMDPKHHYNDSHGKPSLIQSALNKQCYQIKNHLNNGYEPDQTNNFGATALFYASSLGYMDCVKALLEKGADINHKSNAEFTPLSAAVLGKQKVVVEYLLAQGADPNIPNVKGETCLYYPMIWDHLNSDFDILDYLIENGANPHLKVSKDMTVVKLAIKEVSSGGNFQRQKELKKRFFKAKKSYSKQKMTVIHDILTGLFDKMIGNLMVDLTGVLDLKYLYYFNDLLVEQKLSVRYKQQVYYHINQTNSQLYTLTKDDKGLLDMRDDEGNTPLHLSVMYGNSVSIEHLLIHGANPNILNHDGYSPLHLVLKQDLFKAKIIKKLRNFESNDRYFPNEETVNSWFPLPESNRIIRLLLKYKANRHLKDRHGRTAIDLARLSGEKEVIKLLQ